MQTKLSELIHAALITVRDADAPDLAVPESPAQIDVSRTRDAAHGDFATNAALAGAKSAKMPPRKLAELIVAALSGAPEIAKTEIAGPGFINFFMTGDAATAIVGQVLDAGEAFGRGTPPKAETILVEFVSANPNGPLHVGHGGGAAVGDSLVRILNAAGHTARGEYYVNDAGRQMDILAASTWTRYLQAAGVDMPFPAGGYQGDYVKRIAQAVADAHGNAFVRDHAAITADLPQDAPNGEKDAYIDALIAKMRDLLGADGFKTLHAAGLDSQIADIKSDLEGFGVHHDSWFSEASLYASGAIQRAIDTLDERGHLFEQDGALWLRTTTFGDDKDRVLRRANGACTYFAPDIAYHLDKLERGHTHLIDLFGPDHHGYIGRMNAAMEALTGSADALTIRLNQLVTLYRGGQKVGMSTRAGEFVTLRELREEVGSDAARYYYVMRSPNQPLDFDLELAKSQSNDNPVYYIQYAHARICRVFEQAVDAGMAADPAAGLDHLALLTESHETALMTQLARLPETVQAAAAQYAPHLIANYLRALAEAFHSYYNAHRFLLDDNAELSAARLSLAAAVRVALANGLGLLGVSAPQKM